MDFTFNNTNIDIDVSKFIIQSEDLNVVNIYIGKGFLLQYWNTGY